nr:hypothetical protein [Paracoccus pantotrophus]
MAHAPEALLGEGRRGRQDQLAPLLGQRGRAFRDLGLAADIEADLGEGQPEGLHPVPFRGGPGRLGREDMGLGVHEMLAIQAEQMGDVLIPVRRDLLEIRAGVDEQATPLRLRPEEVATGLRMLGDLHQLGDGALAPIRQGGEQFDGEKLGENGDVRAIGLVEKRMHARRHILEAADFARQILAADMVTSRGMISLPMWRRDGKKLARPGVQGDTRFLRIAPWIHGPMRRDQSPARTPPWRAGVSIA